jgi:ATP-dependent helicase/nuclease subunit B
MASLYTIPAHRAFADALVSGLLADDPQRLGATLLLLPSRRACLVVRDTFLRLSEGRPLLLPRLQPIGEPEGEETALLAEDELDLPPAITPLHRQLLLTRLVLARGDVAHEQAVRLAGELAAFLDETQAEDADLGRLDALAPADLAEHWQKTLAFLKLVRDGWPARLEALGRLDPALRRNRLLDAVAARWRVLPPPHPVIAAGTLGSLPAVARLLAVIARLPDGAVVLPGLDTGMDEAAWREVEASHPQFALKRLLAVVDVGRGHVRLWPEPAAAGPVERAELLAEVMRPAATTEAWQSLPPPPPAALRGLTLTEAPDLAGEAIEIALRMREAAETPERRATLVTADRNLARRVAVELRRWGIELDDSAGVPLDQSPPGSFLLLAAHLLADGSSPVQLLATLKHPLASGGMGQGEFRRRARALERALLRGPRPGGGLAGLVEILRRRDDGEPWPSPIAPAELAGWLETLVEAARPFTELAGGGSAPLPELLDAHLAFAERLAADATGDAEELWAMAAGETARRFVAELRDAGAALDPIPVSAYPAILAVLMAAETVRPSRPGHPRLAVLGQLESRLASADLVLLGGLNEGTWPRLPDADPWLNRAMRRELGLPPTELRVGIAAHDFLSAACAPEVVLSRARKDEAGTPTTPSRWLARLDAVLRSLDLRAEVDPRPHWRNWAQALDEPAGPPRPVPRPEPRPPVAARPGRLWVTDVELLMRDPYQVYAKRILRLAPLDPLDADPGGAERGQIVHRALELFVRRWPEELPPDPFAALVDLAEELFEREGHRPQVRALWWPRFVSVARWFADEERRRRADLQRVRSEIEGRLGIAHARGTLELRARADRIEAGHDGGLTVIDYKTGTAPGNREVRLGLRPQLVLEAVIARAGGFPGVDPTSIRGVEFWELKGGETPGRIAQPVDDAGAAADLALSGVQRLAEHFADPATAYVPVPRPEIAPSFNDYDHLSRIDEWRGTERLR